MERIKYEYLNRDKRDFFQKMIKNKRALIRILKFLGVVVFWFEVSDWRVSGKQKYYICQKFIKWHPLFPILVLVALVTKVISRLWLGLKIALNEFTKMNFWKIDRTQMRD